LNKQNQVSGFDVYKIGRKLNFCYHFDTPIGYLYYKKLLYFVLDKHRYIEKLYQSANTIEDLSWHIEIYAISSNHRYSSMK